MLRTSGNVDGTSPGKAADQAADSGAGMSGGADVGVIQHGVTKSAYACIRRCFRLGENIHQPILRGPDRISLRGRAPSPDDPISIEASIAARHPSRLMLWTSSKCLRFGGFLTDKQAFQQKPRSHRAVIGMKYAAATIARRGNKKMENILCF